MYTAYVTPTEYAEMGYTNIPADDIGKFLIDASRNIDTLTFNRIVAKGFDNLTEFQQGIIKECVCKQADFLYENADAINSVFDTYSINSVTMKFGTGFAFMTDDGVPVLTSVYSLLKQTGLCCRLAR